MKILVSGAGGQLGKELVETLPERGHETIGLSRRELDVADPESVERTLERESPDLVINAAAYTNVDACETERELAYKGNVLAPRNLATACERRDLDFLHVSTNYVFDGDQAAPYEVFDPPNPRSVYARTKLAGEDLVRDLSSRWHIVRTAGVYGDGHNFVRTMLRLAGERDSLKIKADEFISPTYARDLARGIAEVAESGLYGLYHITNAGSCSWHEFAEEIFRLSGSNDIEALPVPGSEYPLPAARPANGVLSTLGSPELPDWRDALKRYLDSEAGR